jgi:hypothetical protein
LCITARGALTLLGQYNERLVAHLLLCHNRSMIECPST